ncbi:peptidyl-prolyl cis-trans isomerase FKBP4-like [Ruditapes philippinarum]|uniref:peptidyl-prolyl cis-trans isomerase FKBP4-like n=1 Tax=Ruditapes philippinarum TaxID=129788 RepID=UPI00295B3915|nr:peptidyl-prolyl cis-trans isomerase FKBP4-like [Ruditapes philippinarum]
MSSCPSIQDSSEQDSVSLSSFQDQPYSTFHIRPQDGARCKIILDTDNPTQIEYPVGKEFEFCIGESESLLSDKIEDILLSLKVGQKERIAVTEGKEDRILKLTVTLCRFENCIPAYQLTNEDKFERAKYYKEKGVELFKNGKNEYAFRRFCSALKLLISMLPRDKLPETISGDYDTLRAQCYSNMAACQLKEESFDFVVANCSKVLGIDPNNVKCIYRRAKAYFCLKKYELCKNDVIRGLKIEPKSKTLCDLNKSLHELKVA